jgi:inner membrane protein involved in colicin E2 resistance
MSLELTNKDYVDILKFYKINIPKSKRLLKQQAEKIMAEKLCKCIKKIDLENESRSIGICTRTIFNSKGYTRGAFQCKKTQSVKFKHNKTKSKTRRRYK